jgi:trimeric autotransporter adhesin
LQLKPVNFQWIKGEENDLGFIAQDVADIIPEAVDTNWNSDLLMRYESIIPILTKAIQEQQALIKALEQRILILRKQIT